MEFCDNLTYTFENIFLQTLGSVEYIGNVFNLERGKAQSCHDQFHLRMDLSKHQESAHIMGIYRCVISQTNESWPKINIDSSNKYNKHKIYKSPNVALGGIF